jgi:hypothetical protein
MPSDPRTLRNRLASARETADSSVELTPPQGAAAVLAETVDDGDYPTAADRLYAVEALEADGDDVEGAEATFTASALSFHAFNLGTEVPPEGTRVVCHAVGGHYVFRYDHAG